MKTWAGLILLCCAAFHADAKSPADRLKWLAGLQLIEMPADAAPLVRVPVHASIPAGEKAHVTFVIGFLEAAPSTVRTVDFLQWKSGETGWTRYGVQAGDVVRKVTAAEAVQLWLGWIETETTSERQWDKGGKMEEFANLFVLATVLQRRGDTESARTLLERAQRVERYVTARPARDFDREVMEEIAAGLLYAIHSDFGDTKVPRALLARRLAQIPDHFPGTKAAAEAAPQLKALREVIAGTKPLSDEELEKLPLTERIAALILMLPEQTGHQWIWPGGCDIFTDDVAVSSFRSTPRDGKPAAPQKARTPAGKLVQIGMDAVPQLLEAFDDDRPTRATGSQHSTWQRSNVMTVGDCVLQILQRLSGRTFYGRNMSSDPAAASAELKRNARQWWEEVHGGTEAEVLDRKISAGGGEQISHGELERLAIIAPERIVGAIGRGLVHAEQSWNTDSLVHVLATIEGEEARTLMRETLVQGRFLKTRLAAATCILNGGNTSYNGRTGAGHTADDQRAATEAMVKEWIAFPQSTERHDPFDSSELGRSVIRAALNDATLYPRISAELLNHSPNQRARLIAELSDNVPNDAARAAHAGDSVLERFLATQLGDTAFAPDVHLSRTPEHWAHGARVAEFAAHLLHRLWPQRYAFDWSAGPAEIEKSRLSCLNTWRAAQGLPAVKPLPPPLAEGDDPSTVTSVTLGVHSLRLPEDLKKMSEAWLRQPLDGDALVRFLVAHARQSGEDHSLLLTALRSSPRSGFAIEITHATEKEPTANGNSCLSVKLGDRPLMGQMGGMELRLARNPELRSYQTLKAAIAKALAASSDEVVFIEALRLIEAPQGAR